LPDAAISTIPQRRKEEDAVIKHFALTELFILLVFRFQQLYLRLAQLTVAAMDLA